MPTQSQIQHESIAAFFEDGHVLRRTTPGLREDLRTKVHFRSGENYYHPLSWSNTNAVGQIDMRLGVNPDPNAPVVQRMLETYERTPQRPSPANGFKPIGKLTNQPEVLVIEKTNDRSKWLAKENDYRGYKLWQAGRMPNGTSWEPLPEPAPTDTGWSFDFDTFTNSKNTTRNLIIAAVAIVVITLITVATVK